MNSIISDFSKSLTFTQIAERYGLTVARVIQIFDDHFSFVPRRPLPKVLCIDEIRFNDGQGHKYCCVLFDHDRKEIVDIIQSRQTAYLDEYFKVIPLKERSNVKYFISDMYDGYAHIHNRFFPNAIHIIDMFHVLSLFNMDDYSCYYICLQNQTQTVALQLLYLCCLSLP